MTLDPATSLRIINNQRLMRATHRGEYRDLGGALAITSDAPVPAWNCIEAFTTDDRRIDALLDIGFALLRAFDQPPAARLTPLDLPPAIESRLRERSLSPEAHQTSMIFRGNPPGVRASADIDIRVASPDDARAYAAIEAQVTAPKERWAKGFLLGAALANVLDPQQTFYIAHAAGEPVGVALVVREGDVAGLYSIATLKAHRRRGVASTLIVRAIADAQRDGATLICLECDSNSDAVRLFASLGFEPAHEASLWVGGLA
jgi:ribosomal protein S18 acetylase RimI-like enzyme